MSEGDAGFDGWLAAQRHRFDPDAAGVCGHRMGDGAICGGRVADSVVHRADIEALIEASSLGTPGAKALRARTPRRTAEEIVARAAALEAERWECLLPAGTPHPGHGLCPGYTEGPAPSGR